MSTCEVCGNEYQRAITVSQDGESHSFDCFQCAIAGMAPECPHCAAKVIGRGINAGGTIYCSAHCAQEDGALEEPRVQ